MRPLDAEQVKQVNRPAEALDAYRGHLARGAARH